MKKRYFLLFLLLAAYMILSACSQKSGNTEGKSAEEEEKELVASSLEQANSAFLAQDYTTALNSLNKIDETYLNEPDSKEVKELRGKMYNDLLKRVEFDAFESKVYGHMMGPNKPLFNNGVIFYPQVSYDFGEDLHLSVGTGGDEELNLDKLEFNVDGKITKIKLDKKYDFSTEYREGIVYERAHMNTIKYMDQNVYLQPLFEEIVASTETIITFKGTSNREYTITEEDRESLSAALRILSFFENLNKDDTNEKDEAGKRILSEIMTQ